MKIMVFDVPAIEGGALSVLNDFYTLYSDCTRNEYIFVVSKPKLQEKSHIKVLNFPWIKISWFHRLYFDYLVAPRLVQKYGIDEILSLQNTKIPFVKVKQTIYVHNSLPFIDYKFSFFQNKLLWIYQNVIGQLIFKSIRSADQVIVQAKWMKKICMDRLDVDADKITVNTPKIPITIEREFKRNKESLSTFFYPASGVEFKNHETIIEACIVLKNRGYNDYKIIFTLDGEENNFTQSLRRKAIKHGLPIYFVGKLSREKVFEYYTKSVLIFPSYVESSPLPLTEAKMHNDIILASDCIFSREILENYTNVRYFEPFDFEMLAELIKKISKTKDDNFI